MVSFSDAYEDVAGYLYEQGIEYDAKELAGELAGLTPGERQDISDLANDADYEAFADWCYEHDIQYH
jgi:hypothetical protein